MLDSLDMLNDLSKLWDDTEDDIARLRPGLEEMYARQRSRMKETIPFLIRNLGISYFLIADVVNQYLGRRATQSSDMIEHLQRATQFILYDIWRAIFKNVPKENFNKLTTLSYKPASEYINTIESQAEENRIPSRKVEQYLFNCKPDELVDIGLQGRDGIISCRIDVPIFSIPTDTQKYMGQPGGLPLPPNSEICRDKWLKYFVPQIVRYHVRECSNSGQYLGHFLKNISVKKEDYAHFGYS
ncbi:hypothetical protein QA601_16220 [Chitinispirillales bacterium ANBcel5]|uniref:hypothetical protein n=1 Tax=Cellulosispirillum alkaliphilum TaxID=3039283 RepID=UPI002A516610|nr:hypothetical protein [Chitinispirillales bacterium ANBcel5]